MHCIAQLVATGLDVGVGPRRRVVSGSRDGTVVEHLPPTQASHQCGPGSIPGLGVICGFSSLLQEVFLRYSGFPLSSKTNISKFQFDLESEGHKFISLGLGLGPPSLNKDYLFIYLFIYSTNMNGTRGNKTRADISTGVKVNLP